jgi:hypothetical protein
MGRALLISLIVLLGVVPAWPESTPAGTRRVVEQVLVLEPQDADCTGTGGPYAWRVDSPVGGPWDTLSYVSLNPGSITFDFAVAEWNDPGVTPGCSGDCSCGRLPAVIPVHVDPFAGNQLGTVGNVLVMGDQLLIRSFDENTRRVYLRWERRG